MIGVGGGIWTALVTHYSVLLDAVIALGIVVGAVVLAPVVVYVVQWFAAGGHLTRERIAHIESLLANDLKSLVASLGSSTKSDPAETTPTKTQRVVPPNVYALKHAHKNGTMIAKRLPDGSGGTVPKALSKEVRDWVDGTADLLADWPEYQAQFSGPIAMDSPLFGRAEETQEMLIRPRLLTDIWNELIESTGKDQPA
jgi:hypothetical protein